VNGVSLPEENQDRLLFEDAPVMYVLARVRDGRPVITDCNRAGLASLGYGRAELIGKPLSVIHLALAGVEEQDFEAWLERAPAQVQQLRARSGKVIDVLMRVAFDLDHQGKIQNLRLVYWEAGAGGWADEVTIRENAERFRQLTENLNEVFFIRRHDEFIYVSPAFEKLYGKSLEGTYDNTQLFLTVVHPEDLARVTRATIRERTEAPGTLDEEYRIIHPDGDNRWIRARTFRVSDSGDPDLVVGIAEDITEWKEAEAALIQERERFQVLVDESPLGVAFINAEGEYQYLNRRFVNIFGYTLMDIPTGRDWMEKAFPNQEYRRLAKDLWRTDWQTCPRGESRARTFGVTCKDGVEKEILFLPVTLSTGEQLVIYQDITESKRAEIKLRSSEERYRTLFESSDEGLFLMRDGLFVDCNPKIMQMFRCTRDRILGQPPHEFSPEFQADGLASEDKARELMGQALAGRLQVFQWRHRREDGTTFEAEVNLNRFQLGEDIYLLAAVRDVTERLEAQTRLKEMEQQLRQSQKMEAVGRLAGGVAHDFNNLLQAIIGYTQLLIQDKTELNPDFPRIRAIQKAGERASQLVKQLLLFSRRMETEYRPVQINREVEQVKAMLERIIPKMVKMELRLDPDLWMVRADPLQLEQALLNLGSNAADAMPDGGTLVLATQNIELDEEYTWNHLDAKPGRYVLLTVTDTGVGMDQATVEHIFEPFFTTKEIGKGTGLGLASVFGVVKNHNGYIRCYSEVGRGTSFEIHLPALDGESDQRQAICVAREAPLLRGTETILVVDDEAPIRDFSTEVLQTFGYRVLSASSGESALQLYEEHPEIKLVIMDLGMPGMGGKACLRELLDRDPSARVVIASGYSVSDQVKEVLNMGAAGFVAKPFNISDLLTTIRRVLDQAG
jgi:PAS domain S-box-containing protein